MCKCCRKIGFNLNTAYVFAYVRALLCVCACVGVRRQELAVANFGLFYVTCNIYNSEMGKLGKMKFGKHVHKGSFYVDVKSDDEGEGGLAVISFTFYVIFTLHVLSVISYIKELFPF